MAAGGGEHGHRRHLKGRQRLFFVVMEKTMDRFCYTSLVFKINLKDMFAAPSSDDAAAEDWAVMRDLPRPVAQFSTLPHRSERLDLAAVSRNGGTSIVAVSSKLRTVIHDTTAGDVEAPPPPRPELRHLMLGGTVLIPLGTRVYALARDLWPVPECPRPTFQALVPPAQLSGGRWSWRALSALPRSLYALGGPEPRKPLCTVKAFMAAGTLVWISAPGRGTYSFDTVRSAWRKEGDWDLPFQDRGLFVPEFGLCFGICPHRLCLCAFDAPVTAASVGGKGGMPPAVRYVWLHETCLYELQDTRFFLQRPCSLAYLGDGKFCITWTIGVKYNQDRSVSQFALFLMAVQVVKHPRSRDSSSVAFGGELHLLKHKVHFYKMPSHGLYGYVLQP